MPKQRGLLALVICVACILLSGAVITETWTPPQYAVNFAAFMGCAVGFWCMSRIERM